MKVLLIGATGNLGLRLIPALLTHNHTVTAFIRSPSKLTSLLPAPIASQVTIVQGSATDSGAIKRAILEHGCDAVINTAGVAALPPWGKSDLPAIFQAVLDAALGAGTERGAKLRVWFLGGLGLLHYPGTENALSSYLPIYLEHKGNYAKLQALPEDALDWSILCPANMNPATEPSQFTVPTPTPPTLVANVTTPPNWRGSWVSYIPLIGKTIECVQNAMRYEITLEQSADLIAADLENETSRFSRRAVGVMDAGK